MASVKAPRQSWRGKGILWGWDQQTISLKVQIANKLRPCRPFSRCYNYSVLLP